MLEGLLGNKNVEKVLLFLFVNNKSYGAQLQRSLQTPLTSLQNALHRLEQGRVIVSYCEGKTKLFQINPSYPLIAELEQLLKKAYTLLAPQEKKLYALAQHNALEVRAQYPCLFGFWEKLKTIKQMTLQATSRAHETTGWNGKGRGEILVVQENEKVIIFHERGLWLHGQNMTFSNTFRWTLDREAGMVSLEHLRLGPHSPVFLFHLAPSSNNILASIDSHLCEEDAYLAQVVWDRYSIRLNWRVIGPKKNEEMEYYYS
jgi:hypothetical protein